MPFGCPHLCGETLQSLTSYSEGASRQLGIFSNVSKCWCTAALPSGPSGHDHWEGGICSNEKPRLKCDRQIAPQGIQRHKACRLLWEDGLPSCDDVGRGGRRAWPPCLFVPAFLGSSSTVPEQEGPSTSFLCEQKEPGAGALSEGALASRKTHLFYISRVLLPKD